MKARENSISPSVTLSNLKSLYYSSNWQSSPYDGADNHCGKYNSPTDERAHRWLFTKQPKSKQNTVNRLQSPGDDTCQVRFYLFETLDKQRMSNTRAPNAQDGQYRPLLEGDLPRTDQNYRQ